MRPLPALLLLVLAACAPPRPAPPANETCALLAAHKGWAEALAKAQARWNIMPAPMLAVVRQESNFQLPDGANKQPLAPYGYAQADARTWSAYRSAVKRPHADRANFADAVDFIGWYFAATRARTGADYRRNLDTHYLAYSRGQNRPGKASPAARRNAAKVVAYARAYEKDLAACPPKLN